MSSQKNHNLTIDEEEEYYSLVKRAFDTLAPFYDIVAAPISRVRDKVVNLTNAKSGSKILDVATGTGKQAFAFARKGYDVTGIDLSAAMLKVANKKNKYSNVRFEVADGANLAFADATFDAACVSFGLHEMPLTIREKVLREMVRVTMPRGAITVVDYALPRNRLGKFFIYRFIRLFESQYYSEFVNSDLKAWLQKSGIEVKEELPVLFGGGKILKGIRQ